MDYKKIQFDKLKAHYVQENDEGKLEEHVLDLSDMLHQIEGNPPQPVTKSIYGEQYCFHICKYDKERRIWEIQLLHLREKIVPGIADIKGEYSLIDLPDGKYIAESCSILYDGQYIYMQRNAYCMSPNKLEKYLSLIYPEGVQVYLRPILLNDTIDRITNNKMYRRVLLVADSVQEEPDNNSSLRKMIKNYSKYQGIVIKIDIGMGRSKGFLSSSDTAELIKEAYVDESVTKLVVSYTDSDDTGINTIDLLNDRVFFVISLPYSREKPITHERIFPRLLEKYNDEVKHEQE